jgi:hypothetical protein
MHRTISRTTSGRSAWTAARTWDLSDTKKRSWPLPQLGGLCLQCNNSGCVCASRVSRIFHPQQGSPQQQPGSLTTNSGRTALRQSYWAIHTQSGNMLKSRRGHHCCTGQSLQPLVEGAPWPRREPGTIRTARKLTTTPAGRSLLTMKQ